MATETKYTKSIASDFSVGKGLNSTTFETSIQASSIVTGLKTINRLGDTVDFWFKDALSAGDQTVLNNLITNHDGTPTVFVPVFKIQEETIPTGGNYQATSILHPLAASHAADTSKTFSFPHPITLSSGKWRNDDEHKGDIVDLVIAENTVIGTLASAVAVDDTEIHLDNDAFALTEIGHSIKVASEDFGRVISKNTATNKVTVENQALNVHASGLDLKRTISLVRSMTLPGAGTFSLGESTQGGSYIPANTQLKIKYHSNDTTIAKDFLIFLEYKY